MSKESISIVLSSNTTSFLVNYNPRIEFDCNKRYEIALINLETYHSIPNIDIYNNTFVFSNDSGVTWHTLYIPVGFYDITQINLEIQKQMISNMHENYIFINLIETTFKSIISITDDHYQVDLQASTIRDILGFEPQILTKGIHESEHLINIISINSIFVNCDIIKSSYYNSTVSPILYTFFPNVLPHYKIVERATIPIYLPITANMLDRISIWLTDQKGRPLNLSGEEINIHLHIKSI